MAKMQYRKFFLYNIIGGALWSALLPLLGYYLGNIIPNPDKYLLPVVILVIIFSFLPFIIKSALYFIFTPPQSSPYQEEEE
jgi:membrane-associated protein